jgi:hypothetical protein
MIDRMEKIWGYFPAAGMLCAISCLGSACGGPLGGDDESCVASFSTVGSTAGAGVDASLSSASFQVSQSFTPSADTRPGIVKIKLRPTGTPLGTLILKIEADSSGAPDSIPLATATIAANTVTEPTVAKFYSFTFSTSSLPDLKQGKTYWIRLQATSGNGSNYVSWIGNNDSAYSKGSAKTSTDGTQWDTNTVGPSRDFLFLVGC